MSCWLCSGQGIDGCVDAGCTHKGGRMDTFTLEPERPKKARIANDAYYTPSKPIRIILRRLADDIARLKGDILEPSAGAGSVVKELLAIGIDPIRIVAMDIDPVAATKCFALGVETHHKDFLQSRGLARFSLVIGNPPYKDDLPEQFVRHVLSQPYEGDRMVCFLLRLNWLGSQARAAFHREFPSSVYVLPERPSFTSDGKTDSTEYAWFVWRSWDPVAHVEVLPCDDPAQLSLLAD